MTASGRHPRMVMPLLYWLPDRLPKWVGNSKIKAIQMTLTRHPNRFYFGTSLLLLLHYLHNFTKQEKWQRYLLHAHHIDTYFKILMCPINGSGFISPLQALMIPITAQTVNAIPTKPRILTIKYNLPEIARIIALKILYAML